MSGPWNHHLCERCWFDVELPGANHPPGRLDDGGFKLPTRVVDDEVDICCHCRRVTVAGIYIRHSSDTLPCQGRHLGDGEESAGVGDGFWRIA